MSFKMPWESAIEGVISIGKEWIVDKDKLIEFEYKTKELRFKVMESLLQTTTVPWVDATVKIMYAMIAFARPLGSFCMTGFGMYCHLKGIEMDAMIHGIFDGAFPAWGASRHLNKNKEQEEQTKREKINRWDEE